MLWFRRALDHLEVREIQLVGRKYTWINSQANPTMTLIDKAFCTTHWENLYANPIAQALSSVVSDHYPFSWYLFIFQELSLNSNLNAFG
jgi:hypothetical protein